MTYVKVVSIVDQGLTMEKLVEYLIHIEELLTTRMNSCKTLITANE